MKRLCRALLMLCLAFGAVLGMGGCAQADVRIGLNLSTYPDLVPVPGYPVYYAPRLSANYFYYEDSYWVLESDGWYRSDWYDGPWVYVEPDFVPLYVLRVPVRYYRAPPPYFRGWYYDAPPRWGYYWGPTWERRHYGWDRWDRRNVPPPAPLPRYPQRPSGDHADRDNWHGRPDWRGRDDDHRPQYPNRYERPDPRGGWHGGDRNDYRSEPRRDEPRQQPERQNIAPRMPVPQRMPEQRAPEQRPVEPVRYAPPRQIPAVGGEPGRDNRGWQRGNERAQQPREQLVQPQRQQMQPQMRDRSENPRGQFNGGHGREGNGGQQGRDR